MEFNIFKTAQKGVGKDKFIENYEKDHIQTLKNIFAKQDNSDFTTYLVNEYGGENIMRFIQDLAKSQKNRMLSEKEWTAVLRKMLEEQIMRPDTPTYKIPNFKITKNIGKRDEKLYSNIYGHLKEYGENDEFLKKRYQTSDDDQYLDEIAKEVANEYSRDKKLLELYGNTNENYFDKLYDVYSERLRRRKNEMPKFQEGGMSGMGENAEGGENPACMALQQALAQLPEDLKAGAQQALQTGQCEQFIKMLQEQAQQGGHNTEMEQGMPMAKFGAYFGMPLETIAYNMKIARLGLYSIADAYKAQRGLFRKKKNKPIEEDFAFRYARMTPEEKYQHWRKAKYSHEDAEMMAGLKPFPKETFKRQSKVTVDNENNVYIDGMYVGKYKDVYDEDKKIFVVSTNEKGEYTPKIKEEKKEHEPIYLEENIKDQDEEESLRSVPKKSFLSELVNIAMADIFDSKGELVMAADQNRNITRTKTIDPSNRKKWMQEQGMMDNADPIRGELSELLVRYGIDADLDKMDKAEMLKMISDIKNAQEEKNQKDATAEVKPEVKTEAKPEVKNVQQEESKKDPIPEVKNIQQEESGITPERIAYFYILQKVKNASEELKDNIARSAINLYKSISGDPFATRIMHDDNAGSLNRAIITAAKNHGINIE